LRSAQKRPSPPATNSKKTPTWFAFSAARILCRLWTTWTGIRGTKPNAVEGEHTLFGFLRTEANDVVGAVHPKAMPVILTTPEEIEKWMSAPAEEALRLQRPLPNEELMIVAPGERKDEPLEAA
jgi:putative SOS response-associated peptidase YedK